MGAESFPAPWRNCARRPGGEGTAFWSRRGGWKRLLKSRKPASWLWGSPTTSPSKQTAGPQKDHSSRHPWRLDLGLQEPPESSEQTDQGQGGPGSPQLLCSTQAWGRGRRRVDGRPLKDDRLSFPPGGGKGSIKRRKGNELFLSHQVHKIKVTTTFPSFISKLRVSYPTADRGYFSFIFKLFLLYM